MSIENESLQLNDELLFLIACCQTNLSENDIEFVLAYLSKNTNHSLLITTASQHGILPLVYKTLNNLSERGSLSNNQYTNTLLTTIKYQYLSIVQRNMLMTTELIKVMNLLKKNHIEALAFKGPSLSQMIYKDITIRQYSDLDILIDKTQIAYVGELLQKNNYKLLSPQKVLSNKTCLTTLIDVSFLHNNILIELHWNLLQSKHAGENTLIEPQKFKKTVQINAHDINSLGNELLLVYLCLHGSKHVWERIEWICDIDRLLRSQEFDWDTSVNIAKSTKLISAFFLGLKLTHHFFNTPLPKHIIQEIEKVNIDNLIQVTINHLNKTTQTKSDSIKNIHIFLYHLKLFHSTVDKLNFILHSFLKISPADCITFTLSSQTKFLYIFLRPMRLLYNYGKKLFGI